MKFKKIRNSIQLFMLKNSDYFDEKYYRLENPEIEGDLAKHYYYIGYKEGRNPSEKFDTNYYLKIHKDVKDAGINPLVHYLKIGKKEKRKIRGFTGLSINKVYYKLYHELYYINVHLTKTEKMINLFVYDINAESFKLIKKLSKCFSINRIVYFHGDAKLLNILSSDIVVEKSCRDYYLDIGYKDINICFDKRMLMLLNHSSYIDNICFYIDNISIYDEEFLHYLSYYACNDKIRILSFDDTIRLNKTIIHDFIFLNDLESVNFKFNYHFVLGLEIVNDYFLFHNIQHHIKFFYEQSDIHCKISLDSEINLFPKEEHFTGKNVYFNQNDISFDGKKIIDFQSNDYVTIYHDF